MALNSLLAKHLDPEEGKTEAQVRKEYEEALTRSTYLLRPILKMIRERIQVLEQIKESDFDVPNHYAKYMFKLGKSDGWKELQSMLPKNMLD